MCPKNKIDKGIILLILIINIFLSRCVAQSIMGQVVEPGGKPLPFATIKFGESKEGVIANLNGKFPLPGTVRFIEVSHSGYATKHVEVLAENPDIKITLYPLPVNMSEVVVVGSAGNKLRNILNNAIANRHLHNPDKYNWYQCNVYYKMTIDIEDPYFDVIQDSSKQGGLLTNTKPEAYFIITETYSKRTWQKPAKLQEQILASRMSGFTRPVLSSLITDILPFHAYDDFITLNGKDFYNPVSKGLHERFTFKLIDEIVQQADTTWVIKFEPKLNPTDLKGTVYITSDRFAITHIIAHSFDKDSQKDIGIDQQYAKYDGKWFPQQLNYILQWQIGKEDSIIVKVKGVSVIDSVTFKNNSNFAFDNTHTVKLLTKAEGKNDSLLAKLRPIELEEKEKLTYRVMDSSFKKVKRENLIFYATKILDGKFPAGIFDINLTRLYSYNAFENNRVGWGMQTNEKLSNGFSIGGWAAYATRNKQLKYGVFGEFYADRLKEFVINFTYSKEIRDPGRIQIHNEIDNNTLRTFLISRADNVEGWKVFIKKKMGFFNFEIAAAREDILPQYDYTFLSGNKAYQSFSTKEASLSIRYAFGETSSPFLGRYYNNGTKYPVIYYRFITGRIKNANINYIQSIAAISWRKNINRIGKEQFLVSGGTTFSRQPLPLSKLFAANGFLGEGTSIYAFGAMETVLPYQFYSNSFINFYWLHQFNRSLFRLNISRGVSIVPNLAFAYNLLYGTLKNNSVHQKVIFSVPDRVYHEAALMVNNILRFKLLGLYDATLQVGYFHNIPFKTGYPVKGRLVYGIGFEL